MGFSALGRVSCRAPAPSNPSYATLLAPAALLLERQLRATQAASAAPQTPAEARFAEALVPKLRLAVTAVRDPAAAGIQARAWCPDLATRPRS